MNQTSGFNEELTLPYNLHLCSVKAFEKRISISGDGNRVAVSMNPMLNRLMFKFLNGRLIHGFKLEVM